MPLYTKTNILLNASNVGISFGEKVVLKDINIKIFDINRPDITQGQVVSLCGRSGLGKSLLIKALSGLPIHGADITGTVLVNETQTLVKPGDMGIVPQDYYMPQHLIISKMLTLSAFKNIQFKKDKQLIKSAVDSYIEVFELQPHRDKYPEQLSGGQRQRANIAMQLLNGSNFLLMDEPFSGLDPLMIDKTTNLLLRVSQSDELKTIIIVSHDLENCIAISDTIFIMSNKGRAANEGATIVEEIDLISRNLAWQHDVKRMPEFHDTIEEVKSFL